MTSKKTELDLDSLDRVVGGATINGSGNDDRLIGTTGADVIAGGDGNDMLSGNQGNDVLNGGAGDDILDGGQGNDTLTGGAGNDTFVWSVKQGNDVIKDFEPGRDQIRIEGATSWQQILEHVNTSRFQLPNQTTITWNGAKLVIEGIKPADLRPEWFGFMREGNDLLNGTAGNDVLDGEGGNDMLVGGAGADTLTGGNGNDTFVYDPNGGGKDVITDFKIGQDRITITGITNWADLQDRIVASGLDTLIRFGADNVLTLRNVPANMLSAPDFGLQPPTGTSGADILRGTGVNDVFDGGAGNDTLLGGGGNDTLSGGAGDDRLDGGTGQDVLTGGEGADTFVWNSRTGGSDRITDFNPTRDRIQIDGLQTWQDVLAHAGRTLDPRHTVITVGGSKLTIENIKLSDLKPEWFGFMNEGNDLVVGGAGDDALNGHGGDDELHGGAGNDLLTGGAGRDTFVFRPADGGHDRITDFNRAEDTIRIDGMGSWADLRALMSGSGGDTLIRFPGGATLTIQGVPVAELKPEHFGLPAQTGTAGNDVWTGTSDNEVLDGGAGNDTLSGGGGSDVLIGGTGADTFVFDPRTGGSDRIKDFNFAEGDRISIPGMSWDAILKAAVSDPFRIQVTLRFGDNQLTIVGVRREDLTPAMFGLDTSESVLVRDKFPDRRR